MTIKTKNSNHLEPFLTAPCANAPITTAAGPSGTKDRGHTASPEEKEVEMRGQPGGSWSDTGFLIILRSFWGPSAALTLSLCSSWTKIEEDGRKLGYETTTQVGLFCSLPTQWSTQHICSVYTETYNIGCLPIRPQKRVKVLGMRVCGLISIKAFFSVWM